MSPAEKKRINMIRQMSQMIGIEVKNKETISIKKREASIISISKILCSRFFPY